MEGGVPPFGEIHSRQHAAATRQPRVDLVVGQDHRVNLHVDEVIGVVAEDARQLDLANLGQLFDGETGWPASILVPVTVSVSQVAHLLADEAGESGTDEGTGQRLFGHTCGPQVDVFGAGVNVTVSGDSLVGEESQHLVPVTERLGAAELPPTVVAGNAVFTPSLHVQGG